MIITLFKEEIIEGLQKAAGIIPQKAGAAYLRTLWIKAQSGQVELLSTDSNLEFRGIYSAETTEEGLIGVQGRTFVDLVRRLPAGKITLETDKESPVLHITQGRRKYKMPTNDVTWFQTFSEFPEEGVVVWSGDYFQEIIEHISFCIGEEGMDAISCLLLKPGADGVIDAAGMNGHQFAMQRFTHDAMRALLPEEGMLIQKKYLIELKKWLGDNEIELNIGDKRFFVRSLDRKESLSIPLSSFSYPDYTLFLNRVQVEGASTMEVDRAEALEALNRIGIFNSDANRCTYFHLAPTEAILSTSGQDTGSATECLDVAFNGSLEKISFHTTNLQSIMEHFSSAKLNMVFTGMEGPCGITGPEDKDYKVIIMPMKIVENTQFTEEQV